MDSAVRLAILAVIGLFILVWWQGRRIRTLESDLDALRRTFLEYRDGSFPRQRKDWTPEAVVAAADSLATEAASVAAAREARPPHGETEEETGQRVDAPEAAEPASPSDPETEPAKEPASGSPRPWQQRLPGAARPDFETTLGTRWAVWVGGLALALGGIFLVRYSIEAGIFGPATRLTMASIFGILLAAGGEAVRRTGWRVPAGGFNPAYAPGILTAAGAFILFGVVYAAHGIYGFIGPTAAFTLLGLIGIATLAAALVHGQALAGLGLLGSLVTPLLVAYEAPNPWALFGFLAIVLAAAIAVARLRRWRLLASMAFAGTGLWSLVYLLAAFRAEPWPASFVQLVAVAALALVWLWPGENEGARRFEAPSTVVAVFAALAMIALGLGSDLSDQGGMNCATALAVALVLAAMFRRNALPLLFGAGIATVTIYGVSTFGFGPDIDFGPGEMAIRDLPPAGVASALARPAWLLAPLFLVAGLWQGRRLSPTDAPLSAVWIAWAAAAPLVVVASTWFIFGDPDTDWRFVLAALLLTAVLAGAGEMLARMERPSPAGGPPVSAALLGAAAAFILAIHAGFGSGMTTVLVGVFAAVLAFATRHRSYPVLGWLCVLAVLVVVVRVGLDPTLVGATRLGTTPVLNFLLPGYGVPALAFAYAAWQLARTTDGRPRLIMEAAAVLFALLCLAMLVRHAMSGGVIQEGAPTLAEQAIYTLIAIGAGAALLALDRRSPSPVFHFGSMAVGVLSVVFIAVQHFLVLNPVFTNESTGRIPVANLLLSAYLLPAIALAGLAWQARGRRPQWYVSLLLLAASLLGFAYVSLSVRRLFKGEFIGLWKGFEQLETYSYSAVWLVLGVAILIAGVRLRSQVLRMASAALVVLAVAKVFVLDMGELEGVLRALSFIGLGAVLIGIGLFYQRMLLTDRRGHAAAGPE